MKNVKKSQSTTAENSAEMTKEMFFNIVNNPNYTKKGYCSSWYYFDFNGVQIEAYDAWDDLTTVFSFTIGGEKNYVSMPFKANGTKIRERVMIKAYNEIKRKIKSSKSTEAENSVAASANEEKGHFQAITKNGKLIDLDKRKEELYQFVLEDYEGKIGFTDYGTKEQMAALYADAVSRMERFCEKCNRRDDKSIDFKGSGSENGGEWSKYEWNGWDLIFVRYGKVSTFNSSSHKELSKEMNYFYNRY